MEKVCHDLIEPLFVLLAAPADIVNGRALPSTLLSFYRLLTAQVRLELLLKVRVRKVSCFICGRSTSCWLACATALLIIAQNVVVTVVIISLLPAVKIVILHHVVILYRVHEQQRLVLLVAGCGLGEKPSRRHGLVGVLLTARLVRGFQVH